MDKSSGTSLLKTATLWAGGVSFTRADTETGPRHIKWKQQGT